MKKYKALEEIHEIMEKISAEEKGLSTEQRVVKMREEAGKYLSDRQLDLKRVKPRETKHKVA